jgi:flagellar motor switch protein FliN
VPEIEEAEIERAGSARKAVRAKIEEPGSGVPLVAVDDRILHEITVKLEAKLGVGTISVGDLMALKTGTVLTLETPLNGQIDVCFNGAVVARGEIVAVENQFGVRITDVAAPKI